MARLLVFAAVSVFGTNKTTAGHERGSQTDRDLLTHA